LLSVRLTSKWASRKKVASTKAVHGEMSILYLKKLEKKRRRGEREGERERDMVH
jgi:hypothetical protein